MFREWAQTVILLAGLVTVMSIVSFSVIPFDNFLIGEIQNMGHIFIFGFTSLVILRILTTLLKHLGKKLSNVYYYAFFISLALGVLTEILQIPGARDADPFDVLRDMVGILVFLSIWMVVDRKPDRLPKALIGIKRWLISGSLALLVIILIPSLVKAYSAIYKLNEFPVICDFDSTWDQYFLKARNLTFKRTKLPSDMIHFSDSVVGLIAPVKGEYPSLIFSNVKTDWTGFDTLSFTVYSDIEQNIPLIIRINDKKHNNNYDDRYNQQLIVEKGVNKYHILLTDVENAPRSRKMDMKNVKSIVVFFGNYEKSWVLYLDDFKLHKANSVSSGNRESRS